LSGRNLWQMQNDKDSKFLIRNSGRDSAERQNQREAVSSSRIASALGCETSSSGASICRYHISDGEPDGSADLIPWTEDDDAKNF
uniref:Ig-like domain-containing protein n=1 Tax=Gongylonema pulchrum TaxID=637853 RepID=A0A183DDU0_9BILA